MSDIKTLYDNICKLVLSHPGIIALILKYCTQQYLNQDLEVIKNSIEKNVQKSMQFVHRTNIL